MKPELGTVYDRSAYLTRIDYGYLSGELFTKAPPPRWCSTSPSGACPAAP
ncbi:hypothetical protein ACFQYP_21300 [Nonomuraea antimicrobica]